jgi:serpin B
MRKLLFTVWVFGLLGCSEGDGNGGTDADAGVSNGDTSVQPRTDITGGEEGDVTGADTGSDWPELLVELSNDFARDESPDATEEEALSLASGNTTFALKLFNQMGSTTNAAFSPYSLFHAFGIYYWSNPGRRPVMEAVFGYTEANFLASFNAFDLMLTKPTDISDLEEGQKPLTFKAPTAVFLRGDLLAEGEAEQRANGAAVKDLVENFGVQVFSIDGFGAKADEAANWWFDKETEGLIPELLPPGTLNEDWIRATGSAVFFEGSWRDSFPTQNTQSGTFNGVNGAFTVDMMRNTSTLYGYEETESAHKVRLGYLGGDASMIIIMPKPGMFDAVRSSLTAEDFSVSSQSETQVTLTMPKFTLDASLDGLKDKIGELELADYGSKVIGEDDYLAVIHKCRIEVDEAGSKAAAASVIVEYVDSAPEFNYAEITIDQPFIFAIQHGKTGVPLFLGQYVTAPQ